MTNIQIEDNEGHVQLGEFIENRKHRKIRREINVGKWRDT